MSTAFFIIPPNQVTDNKPTEFLMEYESVKDVRLINLVESSVASAKSFLGAFFVFLFCHSGPDKKDFICKKKKNYLKRDF